MKTIFWNVDTQYDFMRSDGKLYVQDAETIEKNLEKLTKFAEKNKIKVVNTADWHNEVSEEISSNPDFANTFPPHCIKNTPGAEYIPATKPKKPYEIDWEQKTFSINEILQKRNIVLYKDKFDVFIGTSHANDIVKILKPERAIVYGVATNVCVDCAVRGLLKRKIRVYVPTDAIKELPGLPLPYETWVKKGAKLITTKDVLEGRV